MRSKRERKLPITGASSSHGKAVSHKVTQSTIASFHTLLKQQKLLQRKLAAAPKDSSLVALEAELSVIARKIGELGGIEAYQQASLLGQSQLRGGGSNKILVSWLNELGLPSQTSTTKLRMLEIGALSPDNFRKCSAWIDNHPIDLNAQHPSIVQQDFLLRPVPNIDAEKFDIISCSLVLNYVPDAKDRGLMLKLCRQQLKPQTSSLLFVVLPQPCVTNSRYTTLESFRDLCKLAGFRLVREQLRSGGKLAFWLWSWEPQVLTRQATVGKSVKVDGPKLNNFSIVL